MDVAVITQRQVGVSRTVEVPQIQFISPFEDIPVAQQRRVRTVQLCMAMPCLAGLVAAMRGSLLQFCSIFQPPSFWTLRPGGGDAGRLTPGRSSAHPVWVSRMEQFADDVPMLTLLDSPVPQKVG